MVQVPWTEFVEYLRAEKVPFSDANLAAQRPQIERALRREIARRTGGNAAAARIAIDGDPSLLRARSILSHARGARDVFAAAGLPRGRARNRP
jgi:hypothetical protein